MFLRLYFIFAIIMIIILVKYFLEKTKKDSEEYTIRYYIRHVKCIDDNFVGLLTKEERKEILKQIKEEGLKEYDTKRVPKN